MGRPTGQRSRRNPNSSPIMREWAYRDRHLSGNGTAGRGATGSCHWAEMHTIPEGRASPQPTLPCGFDPEAPKWENIRARGHPRGAGGAPTYCQRS